MTAQALKKYRTYLTDENGKPVMVQLDLRNKRIKQVYEKIMQQLEDEADWDLYEQHKANPDKEARNFFEVVDEILSTKWLLNV